MSIVFQDSFYNGSDRTELENIQVARNIGHSAFDWIWEQKVLTRSTAYQWLSISMGLSKDDCHFSMFNEAQCIEAIEKCKAYRTKYAQRINKQSPIQTGAPFCPDCREPTKLTGRENIDEPRVTCNLFRWAWVCHSCDVLALCRINSTTPETNLIKKKLRYLRVECRRTFQHWYKSTTKDPRQLKGWMATKMGLSPSQFRPKKFTEAECELFLFLFPLDGYMYLE